MVLSLPFVLRFLLATDAEALTQVLGIAYRTISAHVLKKTGRARASGATDAVTLIQRFGSALNLNIHFHMLVLDGAYLVGTEPPVFGAWLPPRQPAPTDRQYVVDCERGPDRNVRFRMRRGTGADFTDAPSDALRLVGGDRDVE
jgi:hypothetical protein